METDYEAGLLNAYREKLDRIEELEQILQRIVDEINDYERTNNLHPNPPRTECWDSVAIAKEILAR